MGYAIAKEGEQKNIKGEKTEKAERERGRKHVRGGRIREQDLDREGGRGKHRCERKGEVKTSVREEGDGNFKVST
eukprot:1375938-Amorphochlora_amoeboformis.AAC.1